MEYKEYGHWSEDGKEYIITERKTPRHWYNYLFNDHYVGFVSQVGFGDGYVEIENIREAGGYAVGVASNESERAGIDEWKRERLIRAGANIIIPDYRDINALEKELFG